MHSLIEWLHWPLAPGICVTVLGVEAFVITLLPAKFLERKGVNLRAIILCFGLAAGEIWMVKIDRRITYEEHRRDMEAIFARFVKLDQDILALQNNARATEESRVLPADNLKRQAIDLSNEYWNSSSAVKSPLDTDREASERALTGANLPIQRITTRKRCARTLTCSSLASQRCMMN